MYIHFALEKEIGKNVILKKHAETLHSILKLFKDKTLADGLVKRTLYTLDEIASKTVDKDEEGNQ